MLTIEDLLGCLVEILENPDATISDLSQYTNDIYALAAQYKRMPEEYCVCPDPIVGISKDGTKSLCSICTKEWDEKKWSTHVPQEISTNDVLKSTSVSSLQENAPPDVCGHGVALTDGQKCNLGKDCFRLLPDAERCSCGYKGPAHMPQETMSAEECANEAAKKLGWPSPQETTSKCEHGWIGCIGDCPQCKPQETPSKDSK